MDKSFFITTFVIALITTPRARSLGLTDRIKPSQALQQTVRSVCSLLATKTEAIADNTISTENTHLNTKIFDK
jgi:hypothetical protein